MPKKDTRSNITPEITGVNYPAEIRTTHFPTACALLAYGGIMVSCCHIVRMPDFVFYPLLKGLCIFKPVLSRQLQSDVALEHKKCQRIVLRSQNISVMCVSNSFVFTRSTTKGGRV